MGEANWSLNLEEEIDQLFIGQTIFPDRSNWMKLKEYESEDLAEEHGRDALMVACTEGKLTVAKKLLLQGADVDCRNTHDYTPLMVAVEHNHESLVHLLLQNGADVNLTNEEGSNALFLAAKLKHKQIVQTLLEQEDKIHISEAVLFASQNGFTDITQLLLQSMGWWTPLIHLANKTHGSILEVRTSNELMEPVDSSYTALMIAALLGHAETVETLLKTGSEVDKQTGDGWTALMLAVCFRHQKVTELLLRHRATANLYTMDGKTALQMAAFNGYTDLVDLLCQNGADINLAPYFKFSPLILAASNGHTKVVETLLKYRCNVWYRAPISEKIDMRQKPGQGKYRRRSSGSSKKYLRAVDMSVLFGFNECTQILQQEMKSDRCISAELSRVKDDMQCEGPCDVFDDETVKHKHKGRIHCPYLCPSLCISE
uniref:Uncharacterized protein n=1 Tax=Biomphalaria glabrata TaxID=6526 RepID=A0A2C9K471_BIOGL